MKTNTYMIAALVALAGTCYGQTCDWNVAGGGNWNDATNWNPQVVPDGTGESANIALAGTYTVLMNLSPVIEWLNISNSNATLDLRGYTLTLLDNSGLINDGTVYNYGNSTINGNITNNGLIGAPAYNWTLWLGGPTVTNNATIIINPEHTGYYAQVAFNADTTLDGAGLVQLDWPTAYLSTAADITLTQAAGHRIEGIGQVRAALVNNGVVRCNADGQTLLLGFEPKTNNDLIIASDNGHVLVQSIAITQGGSGTIRADGGTVTLDRSTIIGGTLETINSGVLQVSGGSSTLDSVTNLGQIDQPASNWYTLIAGTGLTNHGAVIINSNNSGYWASLHFTENGALDGTGTVTLARNTAYLETASGVTMTHAPTHTIEGQGNVSAAMINNGLITANDGAGELVLNGYPKTNNDLMSASGGGRLVVSGTTIDQTGGGMLLAEDGSTVRLTSATILGGTLDSYSGAAIEVFGGNSTLTSVTNFGLLEQPASNWTTYINGTGLTNEGNVVVNSNNSGYWASLHFVEDGTLAGTGTVTLTRSTAYIDTSIGATITHGPDHTIEGKGYIKAAMINNGLVTANDSAGELVLNLNPKTNNSLMIASAGGRLLVYGTTIDQTGFGMLLAEEGSSVRLTDATVLGGDLDSFANAFVEVHGANSTLNGVTNYGLINLPAYNWTTYITGTGMTNEGDIVVNSDDSGYWAALRFAENGTLDGGGTVTLSRSTAYVQTADGVTMTQDSAHTIQGWGGVSAAMLNRGVVHANDSAGELVLNGYPKVNENVLLASNGGRLRLQGTTIDQTNGGMLLVETGSSAAFDNVTILGGMVDSFGDGYLEVSSGSSTFSGVTNFGLINQPGYNWYLYIAGSGLTNNGSIFVNSNNSGYWSSLYFTETGTLDGFGSVHLNHARYNSYLQSAPGATVTIGPDQTISGVGTIAGTFLSHATIIPGLSVGTMWADGSLTMNTDSVLDLELSSTSSYDRLAGAADITVDGTARLSFVDAYAPTFGDQFSIVNGLSVGGEFIAVDGPALPDELVYKVRYDPAAAVLVITCPADTNVDAMINTQDFLLFLNLWTAQDPVADWNGDGLINTADFLAYLNDWTAC